MTLQEISEKIKSSFPDAIVEAKLEGILSPYLKLAPARISEIAAFLHDDADLDFDYLMCLSGVDLTKGLLGVVYHLYSMNKKHKLTVKVELPAEKPEVGTVSAIWPTANWHEREAYDMLGIRFLNHPDLRRILLPEDWEGHPLRKDYKVPEFYQGMKVPY